MDSIFSDPNIPARFMLDGNLNTIYRQYKDGMEEYNKFDENNDNVYSIWSDGFQSKRTFNDNHQCICEENSCGVIHYEYDNNGNCVHEIHYEITGLKYEVINKYDDDGNYLYSIDGFGNKL